MSHPYVGRDLKISRGSPVVKGARVRVVDIAIEYEYLGRTPDEIASAHPHLKLKEIHDALSYYYENRREFDEKIKEDKQFIKGAFKETGRRIEISPTYQDLTRRFHGNRHDKVVSEGSSSDSKHDKKKAWPEGRYEVLASWSGGHDSAA